MLTTGPETTNRVTRNHRQNKPYPLQVSLGIYSQRHKMMKTLFVPMSSRKRVHTHTLYNCTVHPPFALVNILRIIHLFQPQESNDLPPSPPRGQVQPSQFTMAAGTPVYPGCSDTHMCFSSHTSLELDASVRGQTPQV